NCSTPLAQGGQVARRPRSRGFPNLGDRIVSHTFPNRSARNAVRPSLERLEERTVLSPTVLDPNLEVRTVVAGLNLPTSMAFLSTRDASDFLVLEKNSGRVERVTNGVRTTVLDLAVNNFSERGLLGITLHPDFHDRNPRTPQYVYL